jgi:beta-glucosidase
MRELRLNLNPVTREFSPAVPLLLASLLLCSLAVAQESKPAPNKGFAQINQRVEELLKKMTLEEKIGQLNQVSAANFLNPPNREEMIQKGEIGSFLWSVDSVQLDKYQHIAVEKSRLHIPLLFGYDVIHGFRTVFPVPIAMAGSWDPQVPERAQAFAAREARASGINWTFGPMVDIAHDARWGRIVEGAGEDPYLGAAMARAQVRGFQGAELGSPDHVLATVKHFAGYGAAEGGRDYDSVYLPETSLRNVYLPPFKAAVDAGVGSLMSAYMDLNDVPASGNRWLLHDVLHADWSFQGFVVTDALTTNDLIIHGFAKDESDAAYRALTAGVSVDMASRILSAQLPALVQSGKISVAQIDDAVRPVLAVKIRMGLFEHPYTDLSKTSAVLSDPATRNYARIAAQRSMVLLRNENHTLPLSKKISSIALIGPLANDGIDLDGGWGVDGETPAVTVEEGLRKKLPNAAIASARGGEIRRTIPSRLDDFFPSTKKGPPLTAEENSKEIADAVALAQKSEMSVLVLGETANMSGEYASRSTLELPGRQEELLEKIVALGKPVTLVIVSGRPLNISWASAHVPAIVMAWQPGSEAGNAIADILFGDAVPGGKLPVSWPRNAGQEPLYYSHNVTQYPESDPTYRSRYWEGPSTPLYPFGYGLSYTTFSVTDLRLSKTELTAGDALEATTTVTNTGAVAGDEVAQLYIHQRAGSTSRPIRELKGFERVALQPGESKTLHFTLGKKELTYWSESRRTWVEEPAQFDVWVGGDSNAQLHTSFRVVE